MTEGGLQGFGDIKDIMRYTLTLAYKIDLMGPDKHSKKLKQNKKGGHLRQ